MLPPVSRRPTPLPVRNPTRLPLRIAGTEVNGSVPMRIGFAGATALPVEPWLQLPANYKKRC